MPRPHVLRRSAHEYRGSVKPTAPEQPKKRFFPVPANWSTMTEAEKDEWQVAFAEHVRQANAEDAEE